MSATKLLGPTVIFCAVVLFAVLILSLIANVNSKVSDPKIVNSGLNDIWGEFRNEDGSSAEILLEIADTPQKQQIGLMNRLDLHQDQGMFFLFDADRMSSFWMRNTLIYLDMIFIDNQMRVVDIVHQAPPCREERCPAYGPDRAYRYAVEANGGWANSHGVKEGSVLQIDYEF